MSTGISLNPFIGPGKIGGPSKGVRISTPHDQPREERRFGESLLKSIALLRGLSALFVVLFHSIYLEGQARHGPSLAFEPLADRLSLCGVTTFFCLSGYLMARLVEDQDFGRFISRRLLRIYPAFLAATAIAVVTSSLGLISIGDFPPISLTLFPVGEIIRPLGVEWTLVYEVFYYVIASLFCFPPIRRFFPAFVMLWSGIVVIVFFRFDMYGSVFQPNVMQIGFSIWNLGFLTGALGRFAERRNWTRPFWIFPGLFVLAISENWGLAIRHFFLPIGLGLIVMGVIAWETRRGGLNPHKWATQLGDASYGIYLLHITVIRGVLSLVTPGMDLPTGLLTLISFVLAVFVSLPFGLIEHRFYRQLPRGFPFGKRVSDR